MSRKFLPYNAENHATIDRQTDGYYRGYHQGTMKSRTAVAAPKPKADPLGFGDPKPTGVLGRGGNVYQRPAFLKTKQEADRSGGMLDTEQPDPSGRAWLYGPKPAIKMTGGRKQL